MLALGRANRYPPGYWRELSWADLRLLVWHRNREVEEILKRERERETGVKAAPAGGYGPPVGDELRSIPWSGEGPDPLELELQEMLEDEGAV